MSDAAEPVRPQPPAGDRRRSRRPSGRVVVLLLVGLIGLAAAACSPEPGIDGDDVHAGAPQEPDSADGTAQPGPSATPGDAAARQAAAEMADWDEHRDDLDVGHADFRRRWNDAVDELGAGVPLGESREGPPGVHSLPTRAYPLGNLTAAQIVLTPQRDRVVLVRGANIVPVSAQQERDLPAVVSAAVSAATGLSPAEASQRVATELDLTEETAGGQQHEERARIEGLTVGVFAWHGTWEFFLENRPG